MTFLFSMLASLLGSGVGAYIYPGSDDDDSALPKWATGLIGAGLGVFFLALTSIVILSVTGTATDVTRAIAGVFRGFFQLIAKVLAVVGL